MADRYLREVSLTVEGTELLGQDDPRLAGIVSGNFPDATTPFSTTIGDLLIRFNVDIAIGRAATGYVKIANLNPESEGRLERSGDRLMLRAGYQSNLPDLPLIYDGYIRRFSHELVDRDKFLVLHLGPDLSVALETCATLRSGPDQVAAHFQ